MKKLSPLVLSVVIHTVVFVGAFLAYFNLQRNEQETVKKQKTLCVKLESFRVSSQQCIKGRKKELPVRKIEKKAPTKKVKRVHKKKVKKLCRPKPKNKPKVTSKQPPCCKQVPPKPQKTLQKQTVASAQKTPAEPLEKKTTPHEAVKKTVCRNSERVDYKRQYKDENLEKIRRLIERNLYYPRKARRRKIEGVVTLSIRLSPDGKIEKITSKSNAPRILQEASIKTLRSIESELPKPKEAIDITIPIRYAIDN